MIQTCQPLDTECQEIITEKAGDQVKKQIFILTTKYINREKVGVPKFGFCH